MKATHRHSAGHEHDHEPVYGLPEDLPSGEQVLWQGSPDWRTLAVRAFHVRKLVLYFGALLLLRAALVVGDGGSNEAALRSALWMLPVAVIGVGLVTLLAWLSARGTAYTLTNQRVVMRIGIVLTVTFNLPYRRITAAYLKANPDGSGDIALALKEGDRIGWLHLWPHVRPWQLARTQPMLRCVPQAAQVAALLTQAWSARTGIGATAVTTPWRETSLQGRPALSSPGASPA